MATIVHSGHGSHPVHQPDHDLTVENALWYAWFSWAAMLVLPMFMFIFVAWRLSNLQGTPSDAPLSNRWFIAAMAYLVLARAGIVPAPPDDLRRRPIVLVPVIALAVSAVWEMIEWIGWAFISSDIFVGYQDTIGDMAAGGVGGVAAGVLVAFAGLLRDESP